MCNSPTPVYEWTRLGEKLPKSTNIKNFGKLLTLAKVKEEDDGVYKCTAKNSLGEESHLFKVSVEGETLRQTLSEPLESQSL